MLCTRTPAELDEIGTAYLKQYSRELLDAIKAGCSGDLEKIFVALIRAAQRAGSGPLGPREGTGVAKYADITTDVELLHVAGDGNSWGTDEHAFVSTLAGSSREYRTQLYKSYGDAYGIALDAVIEDEMGGNAAEALALLVRPVSLHWALYCTLPPTSGSPCTRPSSVHLILSPLLSPALPRPPACSLSLRRPLSPALCRRPLPKVWARKLYNAMDGLGTSERTLARIIASLRGRDLYGAMAVFEHTHNMPLFEARGMLVGEPCSPRPPHKRCANMSPAARWAKCRTALCCWPCRTTRRPWRGSAAACSWTRLGWWWRWRR